MTGTGWSVVDVISQLLERDEREAVRGDLAEAGESAWQGLLDVLGLIIRRQAFLWKSWRPWLAAFGLALPGALLLMGVSLSVSRTFLDGAGFLPLLCQVFLLIGWSSTAGFVVGSVSRRTVWVSAALCSFPCLFCLARFRVESLSSPCLLLFLLPAICGVRQGLRIARIKLSLAIFLAVTITVVMIPAWSRRGPWFVNWGLIWPAWYMVAAARRSGSEAERERMKEETTAS